MIKVRQLVVEGAGEFPFDMLRYNEIGVHVQDEQGVCISLGKDQPWVHVTWECARRLARVLTTLTDMRAPEKLT